jgi:hypothetical protein
VNNAGAAIAGVVLLADVRAAIASSLCTTLLPR